MSANSLVAGPVDTSSALGGTMLVESLYDLSRAIESENWLAAGLAGLSTVLDTAAAVMDPLGQLIAAGLGWLMEHVEPLKGWLNDLTGDAGAVLGFAGTWDNIATQMGSAAGDLDHLVAADLEGMRGEGVQAYVRYADDFAEHLRGLGASSTAVADSLRTCSTIVQVVHDLVRDALAEIVGAAISWAAQIVFTVGLGTPWVISQVATRVSSLAARVGSRVTDVISSARALSGLIDALKAAIRRLGDNLRGARPGSGHTPSSPGTPGAPNAHDSYEHLATTVPGGRERALHAGSGDHDALADVFRAEYPGVLDVNVDRFGVRPGYDNNCTRCVIATDATVAGRPASAMPTDGPASMDVVTDALGGRWQEAGSYDDIVNAMRSAGPGARGVVALDRGPGRVGHVVNVVFDRNGVVFLDGQVGHFAQLEATYRLFLTITPSSLGGVP